jgi:hypothetical protein
MKQNLLKTLLMMLIALSTGSAYAATFTADDGNTYTWTANTDGSNTATITGASNITNNDIVIPEQVTEDNTTYYTVTQIGNEAFNANKKFTSVTFPSTLTTISTHAFLECTALTSITIPSNVTYIGIAAFRGCTKVKTINIDPSSSLKIGYAAFCTDDINSLLGIMITKGSLKNVFITSTTPPSLVSNVLVDWLEGLFTPYFSTGSKIFVPDATDGIATTSTQYKYKQAWSDYSSRIYKYFDKKLAGPFNDGTLDQYYGTLALPYAVEIPTDKDYFAVYTVSAIKKNEGISVATVSPVSSYIPANTGVVLQNPSEAYTPRFLETTEDVAAIANNKLKPCLDANGITNDQKSYLTLGRDQELLEQGQTVIGFYIYTGEKIACNTAYMSYGDAGAKKVTLYFGNETPTSINGVKEEIGQTQQNMIFDLQGRRVTNPKKGIYIVNGKKVLY